jgi:hypothetical protein
MKKIILTYGLYTVITAFLLFTTALYLGYGLTFKTHGILGYAVMIASLSFVYFGIKQYKDHELNGEIDFKTAFVVGAFISIFGAITFGIIDAIYITNVNPDFIEQYITYESTILDAQKGVSSQELKLEKLALKKQSEVFGNPFIVFFIMTMMVFVIGIIISLLSALVVHKKEELHT